MSLFGLRSSKERPAFRLCPSCFGSSHLQPHQNSSSHSWTLISFTTACHLLTLLSLQGRAEMLCYSALCLVSHLLTKKQGWMSNHSLQGQGPGVGEPVATYHTRLDLCLGMSKICWIQNSKICLHLLLFVGLGDPTVIALGNQNWIVLRS